MTCYHPLRGYRSKAGRRDGGWPIVFRPSEGFTDLPVEVPCGTCIGCRLERSRQWAVRCWHEARLHEQNCFLTMTYAPDKLPADHSLDVAVLQKFFKRLRKNTQSKIRYFACGEYGTVLGRPHYHACIFGWRPEDLKVHSVEKNYKIYTSVQLDKIWKNGYVFVGDVTFESAAYVARYILKKLDSDNQVTNNTNRKREFVVMSRKPGIGFDYYDKYKKDIYGRDSVICRDGFKSRPPRFYDKKYEFEEKVGFEKIRRTRLKRLTKEVTDNKRLATKERINEKKLKCLKRKYEIKEG